MMSATEKRIINYLINNRRFVSIDEIVINSNVSERTVYNFLENYKDNPDYTIVYNQNGIKLTENKKKQNSDNSIPAGYEERKQFIYRKALIGQESLKISSLLDYLGISDATLHQDIIKIRREISKYHVRLSIKDDFMYFNGNFHSIKRLIQHIVYDEENINHSLLSTESLAEIFGNLDVRFVKDTVKSILAKYNYFIDEYSLINLLLHILISMTHEREGKYTSSNISERYFYSQAIDEICNTLENKYCFTFNDEVKHQFSLILDTRIKKEKYDEYVFKDTRTNKIVELIFKNLAINFDIDLESSELKYPFILHIDNLLVRLKNGINLSNPMLNNIKRYSPYTYDIAVYVADIISSEVNKAVSESEIAYIALHIGTRIEEIRSVRNRLKAVIVCPEFYTYNSKLKKIVNLFEEDLYITNVFTSFDNINNAEDVDLIISTISSSNLYNSNLLVISNFLTAHDKKLISEEIVRIKNMNRINRSKESIVSLFKSQLFSNDTNIKMKKEAIEYMGDMLHDNGFVDNDFKKAVLYREKIAPTDFGLVAIPHPIDYLAKETVISVLIPKKRILWGKNSVSLILMIAVNRRDIEVFEEILSALINISADANKIKELIKSKDYEEFIEQLVKFMNE